MDMTTTDVKANLDDLKVLGKGDFKTLLKWRIALREEVRHLTPSFPILSVHHNLCSSFTLILSSAST